MKEQSWNFAPLEELFFFPKIPEYVTFVQINKLRSDFHLKGFLNTLTSKYAFVSYLDNEGTLSEDSVGGINTNLLPKGAKVENIDPDNMKLIIKFENEKFIFEL